MLAVLTYGLQHSTIDLKGLVVTAKMITLSHCEVLLSWRCVLLTIPVDCMVQIELTTSQVSQRTGAAEKMWTTKANYSFQSVN